MARERRSEAKPEVPTDEHEVSNGENGPGVSKATIPSDHPIRTHDEDVLGRAKSAAVFADQTLSLDASEGLVVGVLGAWGSGKTSFVNLARLRFEEVGVPILDFNPWMFSGAEPLVTSFFIEVASQLKMRPNLHEIANSIEDYGESFSGLGWLPGVGPWIERGRGATKILAKILQRRREGIGDRREKLEKALVALNKPLIVVLDDVDRLTSSEIQDIFKLVRLTASFPNIIYVMAFDRVRVEAALGDRGIPGRHYLEKILQVAIDLPRVPDEVLSSQVLEAVDAALAGVEEQGPFDKGTWPDIFIEIIRPLIRNMRDTRRYAVAVRGTVAALEGQIALADLLALEAVRLFLPDAFAQLHRAVEGLTQAAGTSLGGRPDPPELKMQVDSLIEAANEQGSVARTMIHRLFPAAQRHIGGSHYGPDWNATWLQNRRVAHEDILRLYLERVAGAGLQAFIDAERAWTLMSDRELFDEYLRSLESDRLQDVVSRLEIYENQYGREHVVPGVIVLLNLLRDIPKRKRGMFDIDPHLAVGRVTYRLLKVLDGPEEIEGAVREILPQLRSLSAKLELIDDVGHREDVGHELISKTAAADLETGWREEVRASSPEALTTEENLVRVLLVAKRMAGTDEPPIAITDTPEMTLAMLRGARGEARQQAMGSRAVRRLPRLAWDVLVELYGDEETLRNRIDALEATHTGEAEKSLMELAKKYLSGWRPSNMDKD